ncbi:MAG: NADH-quinone oxidoreductase subunit J [Anaeromyxobacter sp.]
MSVTPEQVTFWIFAVPLVATAAGVVAARSPVYAAMNLVAAFFFMAGIYVLLVAHLIAFMQILVYAGAVMVLFLFVIMLLSLGNEHLEKERHRAMQWAGAVGAIMLVTVIAVAIADVQTGEPAQLPADFGEVKAVGWVLYTKYLLPFEATSLLLLAAIVGAVVVAKERI